jgi:hypothetical protein
MNQKKKIVIKIKELKQLVLINNKIELNIKMIPFNIYNKWQITTQVV